MTVAIALVLGISCSPTVSEPYGAAQDLKFAAAFLWQPKAEMVDSPEGVTCTGIEITNFKLDGIEIPLRSGVLSSDCMFDTKDYGRIQYRGSSPDPFDNKSVFFVTPSQAEKFRTLLKSRDGGK